MQYQNLDNFQAVKDLNLRSDLYTAFVWAIFTLGASQLALVLGGPLIFLIVMLCCPSLFAFFLFKVQEPRGRSRKQFARPYLLSIVFLLIANTFYFYEVFLQLTFPGVLFLSIHTFLFAIPLLITMPFLRKPSNVSQ